MAVSFSLSACSGEDTSEEHTEFDEKIQPIFDRSCTQGCHSGAQPEGQLSLASGEAYDELVGAPAHQAPMLRIEPGDAEASYLVHKLRGTHKSVGGLGAQMPHSRTPLSSEEIDTIVEFINELD